MVGRRRMERQKRMTSSRTTEKTASQTHPCTWSVLAATVTRSNEPYIRVMLQRDAKCEEVIINTDPCVLW